MNVAICAPVSIPDFFARAGSEGYARDNSRLRNHFGSVLRRTPVGRSKSMSEMTMHKFSGRHANRNAAIAQSIART